MPAGTRRFDMLHHSKGVINRSNDGKFVISTATTDYLQFCLQHNNPL
jgi:hypothetical protein